MIEMKARDEATAKKEAQKRSLINDNKYVTVFNCFGLCMADHERLHACAPSDSFFDWYALNGKIKPFTESQVIADQQATPALS